ncbi:Zn-ribbon domain-containing OB-fold protein [Martelella mediterranea]|uniref:Putative nucleic-acid-binding protein containing a Zn-ribbon n=1 Tax=Martelella mediterranea DSM 17316 TaxID=1122214 RepID=A0A1U9Z855_9HYPH|nr:OB-fold domain-containing protein [Martelella mediterranea]AQZ53897.1 putative nucleic-acid-binding protein containing a Zn-ribbon [Martelella mediterranea DSM 17316]
MSSKPVPSPDAETAPFWDAAAEGVLKIQKCAGCNEHVFYPRLVCPHCMSDELDWVCVSGCARIHALTIVHRSTAPFRDDLPFAVAIVELEEGPRMMTRVLTDTPETLRIDDPVKVHFAPQGDGPPLPFFEPA